MLMPLAFLPFFLFPDYEYNQFLSQAGRPAEAQLGKSERKTALHPGVPKVALNGRDQGCFEITNKFRRIKLDAKFFRFGMEHFKYPAIRRNSHEHMKGKQLLVPGWGNLKRPIPAPAVTLSQQPHTSLGGKN
ncbi:hypothetical protein T11_4223 [Trichinella zimbabwensis]|uniref:Uncharacterized protein n=1 Tax=Trichinella zimbabwensis TaxID=268475 RepID=A0A0V1GRG5_9BILA|nr:hypothetical protein T11_4223 [Trichinella zimbabwensis]